MVINRQNLWLILTNLFWIGLFSISSLFDDMARLSRYAASNDSIKKSVLRNHAGNGNGTTSTNGGGDGVVESYVIALSQNEYEKFLSNNDASDLNNIVWIYGEDGYDQNTLDLWSQISKLPPIYASNYDKSNLEHKNNYKSPHAVGCYLAHWKIIQMLQQRPPALRPELYMIFEDDSSCIPNLASHVLEVARQLPDDWDMLYLAGKPITYFPDKKKSYKPSLQESEVRNKTCQGLYGKGSSPLAPDGSRNLAFSQPYWQTTYMANTHAYVLNPRRLEKVYNFLKPKKYIPIDMLLADGMNYGDLRVFMTTMQLCHANHPGQKLEKPLPWQGFWFFERLMGGYEARWLTNNVEEHCNY